MSQKKWERDDKVRVVTAGCDAGTSVVQLCAEHGVSRSTFNRWRRNILGGVPRLTPGTRIEEKCYDNGDSSKFRAINFAHSSLTMLNEMGFQLARKIDGVRTVEQLAGLVQERFPQAAPSQVASDTVAFVDKLARHKLLYREGETPPPFLETTSVLNPQEIWLNVTNACNLRCITCFKAAGTSYRNEMSLEMIRDVIDQIAELGVSYVVVSGGEPFLRRDTLDIIAYLVERDLRTHIITNGTFIDERVADRLGEIRPWRLQVSLDGSCAEVNDRIRGEGAFDMALRGAKLLIAQDLDVRLYPTVNKLNIHDLGNVKKLVQELRPGFNHLGFAKFYATGRGKEHGAELDIPEEDFYDLVMQQPMDNGCVDEAQAAELANGDVTSLLPTRTAYGMRKINCGFGSGTFSIDADGNVYPCHWLHSEDWKAGNLYEQRLSEIYFGSEVFQRCRNIRVDHDIAGCRSCDFKYFCGGGCRARAMTKGEGLGSCDPGCAWMKRYYELGFWTDFAWGKTEQATA